MEVNGKPMVPEQVQKNLPTSSQGNLPQIVQQHDGCYVSIYKGELTTKGIIDQIVKLKKAFPTLPIGFYDILTDRVEDLGFSDDRFNDAVNYLIDTCVYPQPTIANLISFDKRVKLYTYHDMVALVDKFGPSVWESYKKIDLEGLKKPFWVSEEDVLKYNLQTK